MDSQTQSPMTLDLQTWVNDGSPIPEWVRSHMTDEICPNGTFMMGTPVGSARVHVGNVVIGHLGEAWARAPEEVPELVAGFTTCDSRGVTSIGPGKATQFGSKSKRKRGGERKMPFRPPHGLMPSIEWVHLEDLSVDPSYQRSIDNEGSRRLIASIAANFDWRLCSPLIVSRRSDGKKVIIDGQHRWAAATRRGDLLQLPCCLFSYESPEEEARMFIVANRVRKPMNRLDDFYAALAAADEDALEIRRLVAEAGLSVARSTSSVSWKPGEIAFTASIATAIRRHGDAVVSASLTSLAEAYPDQSLIHGASVFGALVKLFSNPPEDFDPDCLVPAMRRFDMAGLTEIVKDQKGGESRASALHLALVETLAEMQNETLAA